jgi:hypothetical protein
MVDAVSKMKLVVNKNSQVNCNINNNSIQFNFYLSANLTAQRPITKRARVEKKKYTHTNKIQKHGKHTK